MDGRQSNRDSLALEWASRLAAAVESMVETAVEVKPEGPADGAWAAEGFTWVESVFSVGSGVSLLAGASSEDWARLGKFALEKAGLTDVTAEDQHSTWQELVNQAGSGVAQALTGLLKREVLSQAARPVSRPEPQEGAEWTAFRLQVETLDLPLVVGLAPELVQVTSKSETVDPVETHPPPAAQLTVPGNPKTLSLLMEVELPLSVSFGRAQLPLRDVLKLNTGSIVELNRTVSEPVDVIVNNCVIARGEVVVVDGNYGVRIQQVISREERLRTLS